MPTNCGAANGRNSPWLWTMSVSADERAGAIRAVASLHAAHRLALEPRQVRERDHDEVDDDPGLDDRDPPGLVLHAITSARATSTVPSTSPANSRATSATPGCTLLPM